YKGGNTKQYVLDNGRNNRGPQNYPFSVRLCRRLVHLSLGYFIDGGVSRLTEDLSDKGNGQCRGNTYLHAAGSTCQRSGQSCADGFIRRNCRANKDDS